MWRETLETKEYQYTVLLEPAEEGGFVVTCPALPGMVTQGETREEARAMAADAIRGYLESLLKEGQPIPSDTGAEPIREKVKVVVPLHERSRSAGTDRATVGASSCLRGSSRLATHPPAEVDDPGREPDDHQRGRDP
jgi:antitoxin HicB